MNIRLRLAELHVPARIRLEKIRELAALTARAFGTAPPLLSDRPVRRALEDYARFTRESADRAVGDKADPELLAAGLRREAFAFGRKLAAEFGIRDRGEARRLIRLAYRAIGIDLRLEADGTILVSRCLFREFYTPGTCRLIASLDEGLMAGIGGGGRLEFSDRLTSGEAACRARFRFEGTGP
ncbi:MAG: hypothetical protein H6R32_308 [Candidatus Aminicenantes bacterium]|nr:hypothetical protein [Candidatus Aminicenantes bacterium]